MFVAGWWEKNNLCVILKAYLPITCQMYGNQQLSAFKTPREHMAFYISKPPNWISHMGKCINTRRNKALDGEQLYCKHYLL